MLCLPSRSRADPRLTMRHKNHLLVSRLPDLFSWPPCFLQTSAQQVDRLQERLWESLKEAVPYRQRDSQERLPRRPALRLLQVVCAVRVFQCLKEFLRQKKCLPCLFLTGVLPEPCVPDLPPDLGPLGNQPRPKNHFFVPR